MAPTSDDPSRSHSRIDPLNPLLTRARLLRGAAGLGLAVGASGLLAACDVGGGGTEMGATGEPVRGGRLRVGHVGGGRGESVNPAIGSTFIDASRFYNIYDPLFRVSPDLQIEPGLCVEWEPNADSTVWVFRLRPDVVWHDGKDFTADDVIYTLQQMADEGHTAHSSVVNIELDRVRKLDPLTLEIPLKRPDARLFDQFVQQNTVIVQDGSKPTRLPVGTGPFKLTEFTPGQRSLGVRNESYWEEGKPYVDEWEDISIDDNTARLNALLAGEIDMMSQLPFTQARAEKDAGRIQVIDAPSAAAQVFLMRVDTPPFDDVRVRQAFRLIPDRQALIEGALAGFATVGNDLAGKGLPYFLDVEPPEQDLERAQALLREAGHESLTVTLHTSDIVPGFVEAATLFAEQAKGAGVTVNVKREAANAYFDTSLLYTKLPFAQSFWTLSSLAAWYTQAVLSDAVWNETHFKDPAYDKLIQDAIGAADEETARELWEQVQQRQLDEGGYIVWANQNIVDAAANYVGGVRPSSFFNLGGWNYRDVWLEQ
ncbi:MAG: ABC transporter substrate-binding protein [Thermoleophilia bacterium]|nr:ABC transporter substrate-binding protein [Thermoleophilia bacterium]